MTFAKIYFIYIYILYLKDIDHLLWQAYITLFKDNIKYLLTLIISEIFIK